MLLDIIGYAAGTIVIMSFIPQIVRSYRTKSVGDLSLLMLVAIVTGTTLWIIYGLLGGGLPIAVANAVFWAFLMYQLYLKIRYDEK
jgi:MtN3 and saliva related transmembrane protein